MPTTKTMIALTAAIAAALVTYRLVPPGPPEPSSVLLPQSQVDTGAFLSQTGQILKLQRDGTPSKVPVSAIGCETATCIIGLHGTMFDNFDPFYFNPHQTIYNSWHKMFAGLEFRGIGWQSVPTTINALVSSWKAGHFTWYGKAKENAREVAPHLRGILKTIDKPFDIVCHSLGCYLAALALDGDVIPNLRKIVFLNAAVFIDDPTIKIQNLRRYPIINIATKDDGLLKGAAFLERSASSRCIGLSGLPDNIDKNTKERAVNISLKINPKGSRWSFDMTNKNRLFDHLYSFESPETAALIRFLTAAPDVIMERSQMPQPVLAAASDFQPLPKSK